MKKNNASVIHVTGGPDVFQFEKIERPEPNSDEVLLRHTAIGVNYLDTYYRSGLYPIDLPAILGDEAVGVVTKTGNGVTNFKVGDRVAYPSCKGGAYAEARVINSKLIVPVPETMSDEIIASSLLRGMTVEYLVRRLYQIKSGDTILVHAAAGGVGLILCQWAKHLGATVIGTVSTDSKARIAAKYGCDFPIVYTEVDFVEEVKKITEGKMVDVVYDGIGKKTFMDSLDCLRARGLMVSFGNASGKPDPIDVLELSKKGSLFLTRPTLFEYTREHSELLAGAKAYFDLLEQGIIKIKIGKRFALQDTAEAHRYLQDRNQIGAPILHP